MSIQHRVPWPLWPCAALWGLFATLVALTGRVLGVLIAFLLMAMGVFCTMTVLGAPLGIPLGILGFLLMLRSIW